MEDEFKQRSPSRDLINKFIDLLNISELGFVDVSIRDIANSNARKGLFVSINDFRFSYELPPKNNIDDSYILHIANCFVVEYAKNKYLKL